MKQSGFFFSKRQLEQALRGKVVPFTRAGVKLSMGLKSGANSKQVARLSGQIERLQARLKMVEGK